MYLKTLNDKYMETKRVLTKVITIMSPKSIRLFLINWENSHMLSKVKVILQLASTKEFHNFKVCTTSLTKSLLPNG